MTDSMDTFAERMRTRALHRLQKHTQQNKENSLAFHSSVAKNLESQGFKRAESDAHPPFDFKKARSVFDNDGDGLSRRKSIKDPCLLSVAERRKLFEKKVRGEVVETNFTSIGYQSVAEKTPANVTKNVQAPTVSTIIQDSLPVKSAFNSAINDENEDSNDSVVSSSSSECSGKSNKRDDEPVLNISEETCSSFPDTSNDQLEIEKSMTAYPVLQTVKKVKFVSTPKPGRLYPSISDLDSDAEDDNLKKEGNLGRTKREDNFSVTEHDSSFGRDMLHATNSIFSSFHNSRKETNNTFEKSALNEVKELISVGEDSSLHLSSMSPSSLRSIECTNETASFTYMKNYSDLSLDMSPIPAEGNRQLPQANSQQGAHEENMKLAKLEENENESLSVHEKIKQLEEQIIKEKIQLMQSVRALKLCLGPSFVNTEQHLATEKVVLVSQLRIVAAQNQIDRIKKENSILPLSSAPNSARGNVVISSIKVPVRIAVVSADLKDDICNNLLCVIKCGNTVLSTEVVPVVQSKIKREPDCSYVEFPDTLSVSEVSSDFKINVEVYNLVVEKKDESNTKHHGSKKEKKHHSNSKKEKENKLFSKYQNEEKKHGPSSFVMVGCTVLSLNEMRRNQWSLQRHQSPLIGMIQMELKCDLAFTAVQKHGFLTMYEVISGYGAWSRYWFYLSNGRLSFWRYPEEEAVKDPIGTFDLRKCVTNLVDVVGIEVTMRPHTFMLKFSPSSYLLGFKGLTVEGLLLSSDNLEERIGWCLCLNEVLKSIRLWSTQLNEKA